VLLLKSARNRVVSEAMRTESELWGPLIKAANIKGE
jgi:hypothetical protein